MSKESHPDAGSRLTEALPDENRELQLAYEAVRYSESLYHALFAESPMPCFAIDAIALSITQCSDEAARLTGYLADSLSGQNIGILSPADGEGDWLSRLCADPSTSTSVSAGDGAIVCADGSSLPVEAWARRIAHHDQVWIELCMADLRLRNESGQARIVTERSAMLRETVIAVNTKINDPLFVILNDIDTLQKSLGAIDSAAQSRLLRVSEAAQRIQRITAQLSAATLPVTIEYLPGVRMLDLDESVRSPVAGNLSELDKVSQKF
jgi:PAS domain S-box-containing protein